MEKVKRYIIMGSYNGLAEEIDECDCPIEMRRLVLEYQLAFEPGWKVWGEEQGV